MGSNSAILIFAVPVTAIASSETDCNVASHAFVSLLVPNAETVAVSFEVNRAKPLYVNQIKSVFAMTATLTNARKMTILVSIAAYISISAQRLRSEEHTS